MKLIKVCYILSYYSPNYIRTITLVEALRSISNIKLFQARNSSAKFARYFQTIWKLVVTRIIHDPEYYILGFRGYEIFLFVRLVTLGKFLVFDHMMSPYDSLVNETKMVKKNGLVEKIIYQYERFILQASDWVLTDTELHRKYFVELFKLSPRKIAAIPVGADESLFFPEAAPTVKSRAESFEVLYFGSFLPLHGMDVILKAAMALRDTPVYFTLIGGNRLNLSDFHRVINEHNLQNVKHISWVEFEELPLYIRRANLGLGGPFGDTGQGRRVVTGKTFQFLAMAKPVVVGDINENHGFINRANCLLVPQGNATKLAQAISWAFQNQSELEQIGQRGYDLYLSRYSIQHISEELKGSLFS